jgi:hypothetical protein
VKAELWVPVTVFLAVSIPLVSLLNLLDVGGEYRVWLAIAAGALATGYAQTRLAGRAESGAQAHGQNGEHA